LSVHHDGAAALASAHLIWLTSMERISLTCF
jgi:hypothetical protein